MAEHVLVLPVAEAVLVLHAHDREHLARRLDLVHADFAEADVADLALVLHLLQHAELVLRRHLGVDAVELVKRDRLHVQSPQAHLDALPEVVRTAERGPPAGTGAEEAAFRRHDEVVGIRVERLGDEVLGDERAVRVGRVDEVDAEFDGTAEDAECVVVIVGRAPDAVAGNAHGAEAHAVNGENLPRT